MTQGGRNGFVAYEYLQVPARKEEISFYIDCYKNFGWEMDENAVFVNERQETVCRMKRDRRIMNRTELVRLQQHFEAAREEIRKMEKSKTAGATVGAIAAGLAGTAFMTGSVFAVTAAPPRVLLCILLGIPALGGWIAAPFIHKYMAARQSRRVEPFIRDKTEEIYRVCEQARGLLL